MSLITSASFRDSHIEIIFKSELYWKTYRLRCLNFQTIGGRICFKQTKPLKGYL